MQWNAIECNGMQMNALKWNVLRRIGPLEESLMLKTSLLINELTCLLDIAMRLVVLCCLSVVCPRSVRACDYICGNELCVCSPTCACARILCALFKSNG